MYPSCVAVLGDFLPSLEARMPVLEGDFSLNAANVLSADLLLGQGLARLTPTHDLNAAQLGALARNLGPDRLAAPFHLLPAASLSFLSFVLQKNSYDSTPEGLQIKGGCRM